MKFDWQIIAAGIALICALAYVGWRGWRRISSMKSTNRMGANSCGEGCGCGGKKSIAR